MAAHKNQHYVPRCHFKPFSLNGEGKAINLLNISRSRLIRDAAVDGQCARHYFYGTDLTLERALQVFEGEYARIVAMMERGEQPSQQDLDMLRDFAFLQYQRTAMAITRAQMAQQGMHDMAYEGSPVKAPDMDFDERTVMRSSMRLYVQLRENVADLKTCIIVNEAPIDFVTSDDPAVLVSKFQAQRLRTSNFGIGSSGALFFLPLTPRHSLLCYDGGVHTIPDKQGCFVLINKEADAVALNELQYLKAGEAIYFSNWNDRDRVKRDFDLVKAHRRGVWFEVFAMVAIAKDKDRTTYRRATEEERKNAQHTIVGVSNFNPIPSRWLSKLKYRDPIQAIATGTGAGHVRPAEWQRQQGAGPTFG